MAWWAKKSQNCRRRTGKAAEGFGREGVELVVEEEVEVLPEGVGVGGGHGEGMRGIAGVWPMIDFCRAVEWVLEGDTVT